MHFLFVGERQSRTALERGWTWEDGRLAARQLFDALEACGLDPDRRRYANVFRAEADVVCEEAVRRIARAARGKVVVVAMGKKVAKVLESEGVPFVSIPHPAARGKIRKKERYAAAVAFSLLRFLLNSA